MKPIKIVLVLMIMVSLLCFLGSHFLVEFKDAFSTYTFFGVSLSSNLVVDYLLVISIVIPFGVMILISLERDN